MRLTTRMRTWTRRTGAYGVAGSVVAVLAVTQLPFGQWSRASESPVLVPSGHGYDAKGAFNPAAIRRGDSIVMLFRAQDSAGTSRLGYAASRDGLHFTTRAAPVLVPEAPYEHQGGVEDPRLVRIGGEYWLTYTAYDRVNAQLALASSRDLVHWTRKGVIMPARQGTWNVGWTKSGAILDQRVNGKWWMYYMGDAAGVPDQTGIASSTDLVHWTDATDRPVLPRRPGMFDGRVTEPGPPPVMTRDGILLVYNGADSTLTYRTGWALFDRNDPTKLLARSDTPIFAPEKEWEKVGQVPNVVFVEGLVRDGDTWRFYYGGADRTVGVATARSR